MKDAAAKGIETLDFKSEELKIIHRYRYLSWYITSIFYFWESGFPLDSQAWCHCTAVPFSQNHYRDIQ